MWVGGQLVLAYLVPLLRQQGTDVARAAARRFQQVAWPAYGLLLATGVWNLFEINVGDTEGEYLATLLAKLGLVALSGVAAAWHALLTAPQVTVAATEAEARIRKVKSAVTGASSLVFALAAAFLGVLLRA